MNQANPNTPNPNPSQPNDAAANDADYVERDLNRDPITGEHGAHPVGTGVGTAAGGAAAGAVAGAVAGPVGAVAGAVVGGVVGGLAGKAVAERIDPTVEEAYWRGEYQNRPYYDESHDFDTHYRPAYRYGWEARTTHDGRTFEEVEPQLQQQWNDHRDSSELEWERARQATRDAWERLDSK